MERTKQGDIDLILLDLMLPGITGVQLLEKLQQAAPRPPKVLIITNLEESKAIRDELMRWVDGYFIKADTTPKQLLAFLDKLDLRTEPKVQS